MTCDAEDEILNITIKYPLINITMINGISWDMANDNCPENLS